MPLILNHKKKERTSLQQALYPCQHSTQNVNYSNITRAFHLNSLPRRKGSLTVETALVLPVFLFAMIAILYLGEGVRFSDNLKNSLHQNAKELSEYAYVQKKSDSGASIPGGKVGSVIFSNTYVRSKVTQDLKEAGQGYEIVKGKSSGVSFIYSNVLKEDIVDLTAVYSVEIPFCPPGIKSFYMTDRARMRAWTGYDNTRTSKLDTEEQIVYITRNGSVYHKSRNCNHLNLSIQTVPEETVKKLRNKDGAKYYPCVYCGKKAAHGAVYITDYGDSYHTSITCSGLKRDIIAVPISKVGGRPACKTCGR